ncbi:hypothetical protein TNIN_372361 [Trichonephila inaurata madagascariensis]|uniref:Uncharacterized protein n=1 Tax=Trichonephila inaurata madagascariensis TaxID=2747483 RepID=A0A8X6WQ53_9ARAC|nr:hypothetical protein TNIN_372361 [Trichonephila inaurata madagascariensis]
MIKSIWPIKREIKLGHILLVGTTLLRFLEFPVTLQRPALILYLLPFVPISGILVDGQRLRLRPGCKVSSSSAEFSFLLTGWLLPRPGMVQTFLDPVRQTASKTRVVQIFRWPGDQVKTRVVQILST